MSPIIKVLFRPTNGLFFFIYNFHPYLFGLLCFQYQIAQLIHCFIILDQSVTVTCRTVISFMANNNTPGTTILTGATVYTDSHKIRHI